MKNIENGVYIIVSNSLIPASETGMPVFEKGHEPQFVVLVTDYYAIKISKDIENPMTYNEAIEFDLPDTIQGHLIGLNRNILKPAIEAIGGTWTDDWCWCKTEYNSNSSWSYSGGDGSLGNGNKFYSNHVRPVTEFQSLSYLTFEAPQEAIINSRRREEKTVSISQKDLELEALTLNIAGCLYSSLIDEDKAKASLLARRIIENNKELISDFIKG